MKEEPDGFSELDVSSGCWVTWIEVDEAIDSGLEVGLTDDGFDEVGLTDDALDEDKFEISPIVVEFNEIVDDSGIVSVTNVVPLSSEIGIDGLPLQFIR